MEAHAGEVCRLIGGEVFTYEAPGNYLRPVGRVRHFSKTELRHGAVSGTALRTAAATGSVAVAERRR